MGIRFLCPNGHKLNVKAELAGKRGSCPECGAKLVIPAATAPTQAAPETRNAPTTAPALATVVTSPTAASWHFRSPSGDQHGPLNELQFRASISAGRVTADTLLWREGWPEWRPARTVPELLPTPLVAKAVMTASDSTASSPPAPPDLPSSSTNVTVSGPSRGTSDSLAPVDEINNASMVADEIEVAAEESTAADPAALATSKYVYQRRKSKQQQVTLAVAMLVAVVLLAAVLYFVICLNSGAATDTPKTSSTSPSTATDRV